MTSTVRRLPDDPLAALVDLPGVELAVAETRAAVDGLLGHRLLRRRSAEVTAESARAAARLVLVDRGLDPKAVSAPEVGHAELAKFGEGGFARDHGAVDGEAYEPALRAYVGGGPEGVARWVRHCARAVALGAREGLAVCQAVGRAG